MDKNGNQQKQKEPSKSGLNSQDKNDSSNEPNTKDPVTDEHLKCFPERRGGPLYHSSVFRDSKSQREMCEYHTLSVIKNC